MADIWKGAGKDRGLFLTIILLVTLLGGIISILLYSSAIIFPESLNYPLLYTILMMVYSILAIFSIFGMWNLNKWGIYLFIIITLGLIPIQYLLTKQITALNTAFILLSPVLLYIAVIRKWRSFR